MVIGEFGGDPWPRLRQKHLDPLVVADEAVLAEQPFMNHLPLMVGSACSHASTTGINGLISNG
jgi:hypothetical protein